MAEEEPREQQQLPGAVGEHPGIRFVPDTGRQATIARFRKWALLLTLALLAYGFVLVFRAGSRAPASRPVLDRRSFSSAGTAVESVVFDRSERVSQEVELVPAGSAALRRGSGDVRARLIGVVKGIDSAVQVAISRWRQADEVWQLANSPAVSPAEGLPRVASAQIQIESALADVRRARELARDIVLIQQDAGILRIRLGELYSAELSRLVEFDSVGVCRRRQLRLIEQAFRSLQSGDTTDFYVKLENPAGLEQRRAEMAMRRARQAEQRLEQARRSLGLGL